MWFLAFRYLLSRKKQTALILMGIILGTTAYVAITGIMMGFQTFLAEQLVNNEGHIQVTARDSLISIKEVQPSLFDEKDLVHWLIPPSGKRDEEHIQYPHGWFERLENDPRVFAYSPQLTTQVLIQNGKASQTGRLIGSDPIKQINVTNIEKYITTGKFADLGKGGNRAIAGAGLLEKLGARLNDTLKVTVGKTAPTYFKVIGVYRTGIHSLDESTMFASLTDVQRANGTPSKISQISIRIFDLAKAAEIATAWSTLSTEKVQSWDQANESILSVFKTQDIVRNSMTISILLVAGFGIYNILNMMVATKKQEIAILRSMGYESNDILLLFLIQGIFLGTLGGIIGLGLGHLICRYIETIEISQGRLSSNRGHMMMSYASFIYIRGFLLAFFSSSIASILPAKAAAKLKPIEIIRAGGM